MRYMAGKKCDGFYAIQRCAKQLNEDMRFGGNA
jgi:hypothetical protein